MPTQPTDGDEAAPLDGPAVTLDMLPRVRTYADFNEAEGWPFPLGSGHPLDLAAAILNEHDRLSAGDRAPLRSHG